MAADAAREEIERIKRE
jgi:hypothetical protein